MAGNDYSENTDVTYECEAEDIIFLPCPGGSNCGQITNQVAVKLDEEGLGRIYCLAGIGAHVDGMVESARGAKRIHASLGCYGCREATNITESECVIGFPFKDLECVVKSLQKLAERAIPRVRGKIAYQALLNRKSLEVKGV